MKDGRAQVNGERVTRERVTMKTIAEEAGVTLPTVSRILNHKGGKYADDTRQKIFEIASRLKYRPNALVRGMQTGRTGTAGVMVPAADPFYGQILAGIHAVFVENDTIMLNSWNDRSLNKKDEVLERQIIHQMIDRRVEGILLRPSCEEFESSYFEEIWERGIPLILIDREMSKVETDFVGTDDLLGGEAAARHLISLGHRRMLFIGAGETTSTSRLREHGFRKVLSESSVACCQSLTICRESTWEALRQVLEQEEPPTAIFCYNDTLARETASFLLQQGCSIPEDISLVGFGNTPSTEALVALTTFDQHPRDIGTAAAELYLGLVQRADRADVTRRIIKPDLVVRNSTRPIAG